MSVVVVLWIVLALGFSGVALVGGVTWRNRMRESVSTTMAPHDSAEDPSYDYRADRRFLSASARSARRA